MTEKKSASDKNYRGFVAGVASGIAKLTGMFPVAMLFTPRFELGEFRVTTSCFSQTSANVGK